VRVQVKALALGLGVAVGAWFLVVGACMVAIDWSKPAATVQLQEDDPGWDCHTMGNKICGD
jgi:hypothetical protein